MLKKYEKIFDKYFWCPTILITLLCYLFTLTNYSVGVDDPALFWYIDWKIFLQQGRWGYELISPFVNVSTFLPCWIDLCTVFLYILSTCIWIILLYESSNGKICKESYIVFACLYISFPYLAEIFIFMAADLASAFNMLMASLASLTTWYGFQNNLKKKWMNLLTIIFLAIGYGFYESVMIYFLCGICIALFVKEICGETSTVKEIIIKLLCAVRSIILGYLMSYLVRMAFQRHYHINGSNYTGNYFAYKLDSTILLQVLNTILELCRELYKQSDIVNNTLVISLILLVGYMILYSVKKRKITPILLGVCIIISNFGLILATGNMTIMNTAKRILVTYGVFVAFSISMSITVLENLEFPNKLKKVKKYVKIVALVMCSVLIIRQSREMMGIFWTDHQRSVLDANKADHINFEVEKTDWYSKPVVFVGYSQDYLSTMENDPLGSYFSFFYDRTPAEINNYMLYYMSALGYVYPVMLEDGKLEEAIIMSEDQACYPNEGFVTEYEDYIVVKLGN